MASLGDWFTARPLPSFFFVRQLGFSTSNFEKSAAGVCVFNIYDLISTHSTLNNRCRVLSSPCCSVEWNSDRNGNKVDDSFLFAFKNPKPLLHSAAFSQTRTT